MSQIDVQSSILEIEVDSDIQIIEVLSATQVIDVHPVTAEVSIVLGGPVGPPGPPLSPASASYFHTQGAASYVWTIHHNLGFRPNISCFEDDDVEIHGEIFHVDVNTLTVTYPILVSGYAILS